MESIDLAPLMLSLHSWRPKQAWDIGTNCQAKPSQEDIE
jgi:hypothetical protein